MVKENRTNKIGEWKHNSCQLMSILVPNITHSSNVWAQFKNNEPCAMKVLETGKCQRPRPLGGFTPFEGGTGQPAYLPKVSTLSIRRTKEKRQFINSDWNPGWWLSPTPLKNDGVRQWDDDIPNGMESQKIQGSSQHQPDIISYAQPYSNLGVSWSGGRPSWLTITNSDWPTFPVDANKRKPQGPLGPQVIDTSWDASCDLHSAPVISRDYHVILKHRPLLQGLGNTYGSLPVVNGYPRSSSVTLFLIFWRPRIAIIGYIQVIIP